MSVLYVEPVGGIAGDMFLAACLDLGVDLGALERSLAPLGLPGWRFAVSRSERHHLAGTHLDVVVEPSAVVLERRWSDIRALLTASGLAPKVKAAALHTFELLALAEAKAHGVPAEDVHVHEGGGVDAIVDIVGAACALDLLGNPDVIAAPPPLGSGIARSLHGAIPVPGPATLELLRDRAVRFEGVGELTTPTGAALLASLTRPGPPPPLIPRRVGIGVGTKDFADRPNVLRLTLADLESGPNELRVLEANVDDMNPQLWPPLFERLLAAGALDVWCAPVVMKKGRPGNVLGVLAEPGTEDRLERLLFEESTTLGVRSHAVQRRALERHWVPMETPFGAVRIKVGSLEGREVNASPEFEDAAERAAAAGVSIKEVLAAAVAAYGRRR